MYHIAWQVLNATNNLYAPQLLEKANTLFQEQAQAIDDLTLRKCFLEEGPDQRALHHIMINLDPRSNVNVVSGNDVR